MRTIRVGIDFDGVIAYNPFRVVRAPVSWYKRHVLQKRGLKFFIPHSRWQKIVWALVHESSYFPSPGQSLLRSAVASGKIEAHLITARYSFLNQNLLTWLKKHHLEDVFSTINVNTGDEQPHIFKERIIKEKKLDYFIEDNLDIVSYLDGRVKTKVCWIHNFIDKRYEARPGFDYYGLALEWILARL